MVSGKRLLKGRFDMKKIVSALLFLALALSLAGCANSGDVRKTIHGNMKTYCEMKDGTWSCNDMTYKYRLEIKGRLSNAACDSVYVYLSNIPDITFEQAWKAGGLSSNTNDYFAVEDAVLVELQ